MSSAKSTIHRHAAMSTGGKAPKRIIHPDVSDGNDSDPASTPVRGARGRGRGHGRGGATTTSTRSTRATKSAATTVKNELESNNSEDLTVVETPFKRGQTKANKALADDNKEVESNSTPHKRTQAAKVEKKDSVDELEVPVKRRGPGRPRKGVKIMLMASCPEVVPSDDDEEPVAPKAKPGAKTSKKSIIKIEESTDEEELAEETLQKTPKKWVVKTVTDKQSASKADARRLDPRPDVMKMPKVPHIREDDQDVVSPESPSPHKQASHGAHAKSTPHKRCANRKSSEEDSDDEQEQASPTKKQRQRSPEVELMLTPSGKKNRGKTALRAVGFEQAEVIITMKPKGQATSKPGALAKKGAKDTRGNASVRKAPDSASDFFNASPVKASKKGQRLFAKQQSLVNMEVEKSDGEPESDDDSTMYINDPEDWVVKPPSPPHVEMPEEELPEYVLWKKDVLRKTVHSPTPGVDLDQDDADMTASQINNMTLATPKKGKGKKRASQDEDDGLDKQKHPLLYSWEGVIDLAKNPESENLLPGLQPVIIDYGNYDLFAVHVYNTVLDVPAYKIHDIALLYTMGLSGDSSYEVAINPSRASLERATTLLLGNGSSPDHILVIRTSMGPHRAICFSVGVVLQSNVRFPTPAYGNKLVKQIILAPFDQDWLHMGHFLGNVFGVPQLRVNIFGPRNGDEQMNGLVFKTFSMDDPSKVIKAPTPTLRLNRAGGSQSANVNNDRPASGTHPGQSFQVMASTTAWPSDVEIPLWDARKQFHKTKLVEYGRFAVEDTFDLPRLNSELQFGDVVLIYYSASTYKVKSSNEPGLSL